MDSADFGAKLAHVMKASTLSNGRLAADLAVDKSLVGRWIAGTVTPSAHNLARLTTHLAGRIPEFTLLDWDRPLSDFRLLFDNRAAATAAAAVPAAFAEWLAQPAVAAAGAATATEGRGVTGFWRSTRAAPDMPGRFCHDYTIIEPRDGGPLAYRHGMFSARLAGWAVAAGDQLFCCASSLALGSMSFAILNRVRQPRVDAMDGVAIACSAVAGGIPMAIAHYTERIGDLSGDAVADTLRYESLLSQHPLAPEGSVPEALQRHLLRDVGPAAFANGGDLVLMMRSMTSLARGSNGDEPVVKLRAVG